jgi:hypothetical protein
MLLYCDHCSSDVQNSCVWQMALHRLQGTGYAVHVLVQGLQDQNAKESATPEEKVRKSMMRRSIAKLSISGDLILVTAQSEQGESGDQDDLARDLEFVTLLAELESGRRQSRMLRKVSQFPVRACIAFPNVQRMQLPQSAPVT